MPINLLSVGGGTTTLTTASSASNFTVTIPAATGEMVTTANVPAPTTAQVLTATAGASVGAVGTYAWLYTTDRITLNPGDTKAGSGLFYANVGTSNVNNPDTYLTSPSASGTWRCMGYIRPYNDCSNTVFLRIS